MATLTTNEAAALFGIDPQLLRVRARQVADHPQSTFDDRLKRSFWSYEELLAYSRDYHRSNPHRCLFGAQRLLSMTEDDKNEWLGAPRLNPDRAA